MNKNLLTLTASVLALTAQAQTAEPYTHTYTVGDFDGDGVINVADMTHMVSIISGIIPAQKVTNAAGTLTLDGAVKSAVIIGDMNNDGKLDEKDLLAQLDVTLGKATAKQSTLTLEVAPKDYDKLNEYGSMKDFVNRIDYPNFKVAAAVNANEFNQQDNLFNYAVANLDEVVADNAMKMGSVVGNNGYMNFSTVIDFVNKATEAGLNVYGHALAWHSQQPITWLSSLIADPEKPIIGETVFLVDRAFSEGSQLIGGWGNESSTAIVGGVQTFTNPSVGEQTYSAQAAIDFEEPLEVGRTYTLKMKVKATVAGQLLVGFQNPTNYNGCGDFSPINIDTEWKEVTLNCKCTGDNAKRFIFSFGHIAGTIMIDDLQLYTIVAEEEQMEKPDEPTEPERLNKTYVINYDFSDNSHELNGWGGKSSKKIEEGVMVLTNPEKTQNDYNVQAAVDLSEPFTNGKTYTLVMKIKSDAEGSINLGFQNPSNYDGRGNFESVKLSTEWQTVERKCTVTGEDATRFIISYGNIVGNIYIDDLQIYTYTSSDEEPTIKEFAIDYDFSDNSHELNGWGGKSSKKIEEGVMVLTNPEKTQNDYNVQAAVDLSEPFTNGKTYTLVMKIKSDAEGSISLGFQNRSTYDGRGSFESVTLSKEWQTVERECTVTGEDANRFFISYGNIVGNIYIDDLQIFTYVTVEDNSGTEEDEENPNLMKEYIVNYDFSDEGQIINGWGNGSKQYVNNGELVFFNPEAKESWDAQAGFTLTDGSLFNLGDTYVLKLKVKSEANGSLHAGFQNTKNGYYNCGGFTDIKLSSAWKSYTLRCTIAKDDADQFVISFGDVKGEIYIDDFELYREYNPNGLSGTDKKAILTQAMKDWINNMMQKTKGKVKAWDMINEAISGGGYVNGYYDLQHFNGVEAGPWDVGGDAFYWQDFLGASQYGVIVEKLAREAYANVEGTNPDDLKLFINDYNLESDWDDNQKLKSLIYWIGVWEKGGAKIDGIGTQMHISYSRNPNTQASREKHIKNMFEMMAATGKFVRVSELDMGLSDMNGKAVTSDNLTEEDQIAMANFYQWIIEQYLTIVPKEQQWGICQWCLNDNPKGSSWRGGEPVGIHDDNGKRKDSYVGWAEGLKTTWK